MVCSYERLFVTKSGISPANIVFDLIKESGTTDKIVQRKEVQLVAVIVIVIEFKKCERMSDTFFSHIKLNIAKVLWTNEACVLHAPARF